MQDEITVVARRDIGAGGEITGDDALWEAEDSYLVDPARAEETRAGA